MIGRWRSGNVVRSLAQRAELAFGRPLPPRVLDRPDLRAVTPEWGDGMLAGSEAARKHPYLTAGDLSRFLTTASAGYYLVGFWGHGVNSYAFHLAAAEPSGSIWLRLPFGGVYTDSEDTGTAIPDCLETLFDFVDAAVDRGLTYMVVQSFSSGEIRLDASDGRSWQAQGNFLFYPALRQRFADALGQTGDKSATA